jgi:hypothetical protein
MRSHMLRPYGLIASMTCALATVTTSTASSQATGGSTATNLDISPGDRVRVVAAEYGDAPQIATIAAVRGDGIVFRRERQDDTLLIPFAHLGHLDVSDGRRTHVGAGLGIGLAGGALVGALAGRASYSKNDFPLLFSPVALTAGGAVLGGLAGAVIGGIVGAIPTERWRTVPLNSRVDDAQASVNLVPSPKGPRLAVGVALRF